MKNIANHIFTASALLASMMSFAACDEVSENERLIYVEPAAVKRAVLIEDFTGQYCVNCPKATDEIHKIQELYGEDNIIAVAIHCGRYGFSGSKKQVGLKTDLGQEYWDKWFVDGQGQPIGKVNRGASCEFADWGAQVAASLSASSNVTLTCDVTYDESSRQVAISSSGLAPMGYKANLQLWVVEDSIVAMQYQPDGKPIDYNYVHNHVLRDAINGTWGEEVKFQDAQTVWTHSYILPEKYVAENCSVVAFVYDDYGVQQVCKSPFVKK